MEYRVKGRLTGHKGTLININNEIQPLGYQTKFIGSEQLELSKNAQIESVLDELVPILEVNGWNVYEELRLEESNSEETMRNIYDNGRIIREFPRGV